MRDLISKSEMKEWFENWFKMNRYYHPYAKKNDIPICELYDILQRMPTVEEKRGKWMHDADGLVWCYGCGFGKERSDERPYHYCPNCGARMSDERAD